MQKRWFVYFLIGICFWWGYTVPVKAEEDPVIVVIDPGHGGENLGGLYEDYTEKEMTMIVAQAMKEELEQYEGITVYLTRDGDQELSLEERADYAAAMQADFLFCLHFNLSENHTLFGAECWVPAFGENYSKGYSFAATEMELLTDTGLYSLVIKTRLNKKGTDHYCIIRQSTANNVPCVLIEHCHLDHPNDQPYYDHSEKLKEFGVLDATAVAKYFHLYSESLQKDFRDYQNLEVAIPQEVVKPDSTEPERCELELLSENTKTGEITLQLTASDADSGMQYYSYSYDGGQTDSGLLAWPDRSKDSFSFTIQVPDGTTPTVTVNAYNGYDLYTTSNELILQTVAYPKEEEIESIEPETEQEAPEDTTSAVQITEPVQDIPNPETKPEDNSKDKTDNLIVAGIAACIIVPILVLIGIWIKIFKGHRRGHRRRRRRR